MDPAAHRQLGRTGMSIPQLGLGTAMLGSAPSVVSDEVACLTMAAAWDAGIRYFDTSPWYGIGRSEERVGRYLRERSKDEYLLSTKVGRVLEPGTHSTEVIFDYSYDGIMRSFDDSLQRLGVPGIDLLLIHDLDAIYHQPSDVLDRHWTQLESSGWRALCALKDSQVVRSIGAGINTLGLIPRFLDHFSIDMFLVATPYTLLDHGALATELPMCAERGVGVVAGSVFATGILATGPRDGAQYNYRPAGDEVMQRVRTLQTVCRQHGISLRAAAMQFPLGHPAIAGVLAGAVSPDQVIENVAAFREPVPGSLWLDLKHRGLLPDAAPTPI